MYFPLYLDFLLKTLFTHHIIVLIMSYTGLPFIISSIFENVSCYYRKKKIKEFKELLLPYCKFSQQKFESGELEGWGIMKEC